jgi:WD40 repeat protein
MSSQTGPLPWLLGVALLAAPLLGTARAQENAAILTDLFGDPLPHGAIARLGTVRFRDADGAGHVVFGPQGKTVITTARARSLCFWSTADGRLLRRIDGDGPLFKAIAVSPNGELLAAGGAAGFGQGGPVGRGCLTLYETATGKQRQVIRYPDLDSPNAVAFSPDGRTLTTSNRENTVRIWDIAAGKEILRSFVTKQPILTEAISAHGNAVAVAGDRKADVLLWQRHQPDRPRVLKRLPRGAMALAFAPDGKTLASSDDGAGVRLWDVASGRLARSLVAGDSQVHVRGLAFSRDGKTLAAFTDLSGKSAIVLWAPATGRELRRLDMAWERGDEVAFSADGRLVAAAVRSGVRVWHVQSGQEIGEQAPGHRGAVGAMAIAPRGDVIATAGDDFTVRLWETGTGRQRLLLSHGAWVRAVALSPDGKRLASSSLDDTVRLWDAGTGREIYRLPGHGKHGGHRSLAFSANGKTFASWGDDLYLRVWDVATGKAVREHRIGPSGIKLPDEDEDENPIRRAVKLEMGLPQAALTPDGKAVLVSSRDKLHVLDVHSGKELRSISYAAMLLSPPVVSPDGQLLLLSGLTGDQHGVGVWHYPSGKMLRTLLIDARQAGPAALSADGRMLATATYSAEGKVRLWEWATGGQRLTLDGGKAGHCLAFSPDGRYLVTAMQDSSVLVWDLMRLRK